MGHVVTCPLLSLAVDKPLVPPYTCACCKNKDYEILSEASGGIFTKICISENSHYTVVDVLTADKEK